MDVLDLDMRNIPCWRIVSRKFCPWSHVNLSEPMQQFRSATFRHSNASRNNQIIVKVLSYWMEK